MEVLDLILGFFEVLDFVCWVFDATAWVKGRANRAQRREARRAGIEKPARDRWGKAVLVLTPIVLALTLALIYFRWMWIARH